jgi:site-specific recombinase XerD
VSEWVPFTELSPSDRIALKSLGEGLVDARQRGDGRPSFAVISACLDDLGVQRPERCAPTVSLVEARTEWLDRLRSSNRSASTLAGYRVAVDDLLAFLKVDGLDAHSVDEGMIVSYFNNYRRSKQPAEASYYRRFTLLRRFFRWLSQRSGTPDPFLNLEPPPKPQQEANWLTPDQFAQLLAAAGTPSRRRPGLAERDQLVLLALVTTGLRRSELLAVDWQDLDLGSDHPSLLVRRGKGGKPRRQPLLPELAARLTSRRALLAPSPSDPVFCGLEGKRLHTGILALIIRRAAERAGLDQVSAHTLRHTAATWLRQETGDARLVAAYLGHADLSTVSRYAHVAEHELHDAARSIGQGGNLGAALSALASGC